MCIDDNEYMQQSVDLPKIPLDDRSSGQTTKSPLPFLKPLRILDNGLVPRNDAAIFIRPLMAAAHAIAVLVSRIVHENGILLIRLIAIIILIPGF
jgi:hypothetical protein